MDQHVRCILCRETFDLVSLHNHMSQHHPFNILQAACFACLLQTLAERNPIHENGDRENIPEENGRDHNNEE